jgi:hypothetical protein
MPVLGAPPPPALGVVAGATTLPGACCAAWAFAMIAAALNPIATVRCGAAFAGAAFSSPGFFSWGVGGRFGAFAMIWVPGFFARAGAPGVGGCAEADGGTGCAGGAGGLTEDAFSLALSIACWKAPRCEIALLTASGETCEGSPSRGVGGREGDRGGGGGELPELEGGSSFTSSFSRLFASIVWPRAFGTEGGPEEAAALSPGDESGRTGSGFAVEARGSAGGELTGPPEPEIGPTASASVRTRETGELGEAVAANGFTCDGGS